MVLTDKLNRAALLAVASLLFLASLVPLLTREKASAYTLLGPREIKMSSASPGNAANGSGAGVTYRVQFDVATTDDLGGIVVTFCENSPIIEDGVCDFPTGFVITGATVGNQSDGTGGTLDITSFTTTQIEDHSTGAAGNNTLTLSDSTPVSATAEDTVSFEISGITNPNAVNASFYARIYTYDTEAGAQAYDFDTPATLTPAIDAGGIALSTAQQITVTAKVQERLTFCIYTDPFTISDFPDIPDDTDITNNCSGKSGSAIVLGDNNGVLDSVGPYVDKTAYFGIATNAAGDAVVRLKGNTLSNGVDTIDAIGATPTVSTPATEQFGLCIYQIFGAGLTISNGTALAPDNVDYTGGAGTCAATTQTAGLGNGSGGAPGTTTFAFDTANTNTTYGQIIATKPAGSPSTGNLVFIGNISDTTEPGIYTTTLSFIATGTY